uniref:uncharacterized protein LOC120345307 n=1 Tax=Styela clava TaxID=7725 RepID=UPI00193A5515|nr:uncharacterized protein LOC120345307 [Styela clava]
MWETAKCLPEGDEFPQKLDSDQFDNMGQMNIREVGNYYNATALEADNGNVESQKKCFGLVYPDHCVKYYGPHWKKCLETIWESSLCLEEGTKHPDKLTEEERDQYDELNLREIIHEFNTTQSLADSDNATKQMECFGLVYPDGCLKYYGPHPLDCLVTMWYTASCLFVGTFHPSKLNMTMLKWFDNLNIREIETLYNTTSSKADNEDVESQKKCFGMEYPNHCVKYYGPHPHECLETIWESFRCLNEGTKHPDKLTQMEIYSFDGMDLREIIGIYTPLTTR